MKKAEQADSYSNIVKYTGIFGGVQGLGILMSVVRNKLVAMMLGPDGMGLIALFNSTVKLVSDSTNLGISVSAVKNISADYDENNVEKLSQTIKTVRSWSLLVGIVGMFLCIALSPLLSKWTFSWDGHTLHFIFLSPIVALTAITGGEMAILKGTRQLRNLAIIPIYTIFAALAISIPLYYIYREKAIVPSLVLLALAQMLLCVMFSYRKYPLSFSGDKSVLVGGVGMVRLGVAFVFAGVLGSGAEFAIRSFLSNVASVTEVGLYNAGYMMTMTYAGMVFSAMETEYFPRLSAIKECGAPLSEVVNRQIEVTLLLVSPLLVFFLVSLPVLLPLLYSGKFLPAIGMVQIMVFAMFLRAMNLPVEYISLSKGDSATYLTLEAIYDISLVGFVVYGYGKWGLTGTGAAITMTSLLNFAVVYLYANYKYGYRPSAKIFVYAAMQLPLCIVAYLMTSAAAGILYWIVGCLLFCGSLAVSLGILKSKTSLWNSLRGKFIRKFGRDV